MRLSKQRSSAATPSLRPATTDDCRHHAGTPATDSCRTCRYAFCRECLAYPFGAAKPPLCHVCLLRAAGIRGRLVKRETKPHLLVTGLPPSSAPPASARSPHIVPADKPATASGPIVVEPAVPAAADLTISEAVELSGATDQRGHRPGAPSTDDRRASRRQRRALPEPETLAQESLWLAQVISAVEQSASTHGKGEGGSEVGTSLGP